MALRTRRVKLFFTMYVIKCCKGIISHGFMDIKATQIQAQYRLHFVLFNIPLISSTFLKCFTPPKK